MVDINIKEYLMSLGYEVDETSYNKFVSTLKKVDTIVDKHTSTLAGGFAKAGLIVTSAIGSIVISTYEMMESIAKADMGYEKLALRMDMTKDAAKAYTIALKVLGEEPENIRWIPELHKHYMELMSDAQRLALPKDFNNRIQDFRSMSFEFKRMRQEMTYGVEWIGFSILNHLVDPLGKAKYNLHSLNEMIIENIPRWTERIGDALGKVMKFFDFLWEIAKKVGTGFGIMWDSMGDPVKMLLVIAGIGKVLMMMSPLLRTIAAVTFIAVEMYDALGGRKTFLPIAVWWTFATVVDAVLRGLMGITSILEHGTDFEKMLQGYARFGIQKVGALGLKHIPGLKKIGEKQDEYADSWLKYARENWGKAKGLPGELNTIFNPSAEGAFPGLLGKMPDTFYYSDERREEINQQMKASSPMDMSKLGTIIQKASEKTGVAPDVIYGQWYGETGGFKNRGAKELNNLAGINIPGGKGTDYKKFASLEEFANQWAWMINSSYPKARGAQSAETFAAGLKSGLHGSWYSDTQSNYTEMIKRGMSQYGGGGGNVAIGSNNSTEIHIDINGANNPLATAEAVRREIEPYINMSNRSARDKNQAQAILAGFGNRPSTQGAPMTPVAANQ